MRLMPIRHCRPGMRLGKNIYNEEGIVLLSVYAELTQRMIDRLGQSGVDQLYINDPRTDDVEIPEVISEYTRIRSMKTIRSAYREAMGQSLRTKAVFNRYLGKDFRDLMTLIIDDVGRQSDAMLMLSSIQIADFYLYLHSLNVCVFSTLLGMSQGYSREELTTLGMGGLLHDIGMTRIPPDILQKPGNLSEEELAEMRKHVEFGYQMLKDEPGIPLLSAHCALQHHERLDGSGYPRGLKGSDIHEYARWIGLVDSYDAMTSKRIFRSALLPHQALEILYTGSGTLYDKEKIEMFRDRIAIYPLGATVKLNTGETGVVVDLNSSFPQRPIVRILVDPDGNELNQPYEIDLSKKLTILVTDVNDIKIEQYI